MPEAVPVSEQGPGLGWKKVCRVLAPGALVETNLPADMDRLVTPEGLGGEGRLV